MGKSPISPILIKKNIVITGSSNPARALAVVNGSRLIVEEHGEIGSAHQCAETLKDLKDALNFSLRPTASQVDVPLR